MLFLEDVFGEHACLWIAGLENGLGGYVWRVSLEDLVVWGPTWMLCLGNVFGGCVGRAYLKSLSLGCL